MHSLLKKIWTLLSHKEKMSTVVILLMMLISSALELIGIGLILPIIALIAKPDLIEHNKYLHVIYDFINPSSYNSFLIILCIMLIVLYIVKNLFLIFQNYTQSHFILKKGAILANRLFSNYIHAPYKYHLSHNSSYLLGNVTLARILPINILVPFMTLCTESIVVIAIFIMLLFLSPLVTLGLVFSTLIVAGIIYYPLRKLNYHLGKILHIEMLEINKYALQGLKAIKESKVRNTENFFTEQHNKHQMIYNIANANTIFLSNLPRFMIEAIVIILGLGTLLILILSGMAIGSIILTIALFGASAIRLMPSMTRIQYSLTTIKQHLHFFNTIFDDITDFELDNSNQQDASLSFNKTIEIKNISFGYAGNTGNIFNDFSLTIDKNLSIAFIGPTGCGKTTIVDIILGLLKPESGCIKVDGVNINVNLSCWQKKIGYVPQQIFLLDDTVKANVAFGEPYEKIDDNRVIECLNMAQVLKFIDSLPKGINNLIGENGIRLSGGQRQRIGIARALYHAPELLILDEATSALDRDTEKAFIDALNNLKGKLTILMIAHRLTTVENCDKIVKLNPIVDQSNNKLC